MKPLRIALIGAGGHAASQHLPALLDHALRHPDSVTVAAVCDRDRERATVLAAPLGASIHEDWQHCLEQIQPDAVLACVPPTLTPTLSLAAAGIGAAVWVEKPLAPSLAEAEALVAGLAQARAMASMNRRFDPAMVRLRELAAGRQPRLLRASMARGRRLEPDFISATGVHIVDLAISLVGPPAGPARTHSSTRHGARWAQLAWTTAEGCAVEVDIRPSLGQDLEAVEMVGEGWRGEARSAWFDLGQVDWREAGSPAQRECIDPDLPVWVRNGTAAETSAFIAACHGTGPWWPSPADVLPATALCHAAASTGAAD